MSGWKAAASPRGSLVVGLPLRNSTPLSVVAPLRRTVVRLLRRVIRVVAAASLLVSCATYKASRYGISSENVTALRAYKGSAVSLGDFTMSEGAKDVDCRLVGPIATPDGEPFEKYIRSAFLEELKLAEVYAESAPVTLSGNVDVLELSSTNGKWHLQLTLRSSTGRTLVTKVDHSFTTGIMADQVCAQTAQAFAPAVQRLIAKTISDPEFAHLMR